MNFKLRGRLLSGFLAVALLVLFMGGVGVFLVGQVSTIASEALSDKVPQQYKAIQLKVSMGRSIGLLNEYLLNADANKSSQLKQKIVAEEQTVEALLTSLEQADSGERLAGVRALVAAFNEAQHKLVNVHDQKNQYWFTFDGQQYDLKTFVLQQRIALGDWLSALEQTVKYDVKYDGNLDVKKSDFNRWFAGFQSPEKALTKLLGKYAKTNVKLFEFAIKVNDAEGDLKLSHFERGRSRQVGKATKGLDKVVRFVVPAVDQLIAEEGIASGEMALVDEQINAALNDLLDDLNGQVADAKVAFEDIQASAWVILVLGSLISLAIAITIALVIAKGVVSPIHRLRDLMIQVSNDGRFDLRVENNSVDEVGETARALNALLTQLQGAISEIGDVMTASAEGNFSHRVTSSLAGDLDSLKSSINNSVSQTQSAISRVNAVMSAVESGDFEKRVTDDFGGELHHFKNTVNGALDSLQQMTGSLTKVMRAIEDGDFDYRMDGASGSDIAASVNRAMESMQRVVSEISSVMQSTAAGDLTCPVQGQYTGHLASLTRSINESLGKQQDVVGDVRRCAEDIKRGVSEIAQGNKDLSARTTEQAASLEQTSASMEQMSSTVSMNAENAKVASGQAAEAKQLAEQGATIVGRTVAAMQRIDKSSRKIADIISVIDAVAFQTNLLALNASVEAARAGEQGRGFAVVAGEVRILAQRSSDAAKDISLLIEESVARVREGSDLASESGNALDSIKSSIDRVNDVMVGIASASHEQAQGVVQVNESVSHLEQVNQQNTALVEEAAAASETMNARASELIGLVDFFTLARSHKAANVQTVKVSSFSAPSDQPKLSSGAENSEAGADEWQDF
jgi:methyl-accepting chemotaxis protein